MKPTSDQLSLFDELLATPMPTPGSCEFERHLFLYGEKPKSLCGFRGSGVWVNCRDIGHCVWDGWDQRGTSDGLTTDDGGDEE